MNGCLSMMCPKRAFILKWLEKIFVKYVVRRQSRKDVIDNNKLSPHLMNDLGFDRHGNPLQWSTFSPSLRETKRKNYP